MEGDNGLEQSRLWKDVSKSVKIIKVLITFKENCPDIRNFKVVDIVKELLQININVNVFDHHTDSHELVQEFVNKFIESIKRTYTGILLAISHYEFLEIDPERLKANSS